MATKKPQPTAAELVGPMPPDSLLLDTPRPVSLGVLSHYSSLPATEGAGIITTLDLTRAACVLQLQHALAGESVSLWDMPSDAVIGVEHLVAHYAESVDEETGALRQGPMLTLIGPSGVYHTGSEYAFRALQLIAMLLGAPPWNPPITIRPIKCRSRRGRTYQSLVLQE